MKIKWKQVVILTDKPLMLFQLEDITGSLDSDPMEEL
jgi:hypothetical protein